MRISLQLFHLLGINLLFSSGHCFGQCDYKIIYTKLYETVSVDTNELTTDLLNQWIIELDCIPDIPDWEMHRYLYDRLDYDLDIYIWGPKETEHLDMRLSEEKKEFLERFLHSYFREKRLEFKAKLD